MEFLESIHAFFCKAIETTLTICSFVFIVVVIFFAVYILMHEIKKEGGLRNYFFGDPSEGDSEV